MKMLLFIFLEFIFLLSSTDNYKVYRKNLEAAPFSSVLCNDMLEELKKSDDKKSKGYYGAYQMIQAKHLFSPFAKLKSFNSGKIKLEQAIKSLPQDVELRYLRFAIQTSIPKMLNYSANIAKDKEFMLSKIKEQPEPLQSDIKKLIQEKNKS